MTRTPEWMREARRLFEAALELPAAERTAFVERAAPEDIALRQTVQALLVAHDSDDPFFNRPAAEHAGLAALPDQPSLLGRMLGPYQVVGVLGRGGMGTVYAATRADGQFTRRVAVKTLRGAAGRAELEHRFRREGQIQAGMAHPNIAALLDAGVTEDGIPYLVMELVDGQPIDRYCESRRLDLAARLDLFRQVVQAVQHAHARLVVHRDLKPGNILVTPEGVVKLLDFGIAKLMDTGEDETATTSFHAFTTRYASPEQLRGEPISIATDIYNLGTVLFRLLTGRHPFEVDPRAPAAAAATICEEPALPPSRVASAGAAHAMGLPSAERLQRLLEGDLDAIALMALRKEPERRYRTADAMADDILRYARRLPVLARPDSRAYRLRKFAARNRVATVAVTLAALAMLGGTGIALWQARAARTSALRAAHEQQTAERVSGFLRSIFALADPSFGGGGLPPDAPFSQVIDATAERVREELGHEPLVAEPIHQVLFSLYATFGSMEQAEYHVREFLRLLNARDARGVDLARGLRDLGRFHYLSGEFDSAYTLLAAAHQLFDGAGSPPTPDLVETLIHYAVVLWDRGTPEEAEPLFRQALEVHTRLFGEDARAAFLHNMLGLVRGGMGDLAGLEVHLAAADRIFRSRNDREYYEHGNTLNALANTALLRGDAPRAARHLDSAFAIWERTLGPESIFETLGLVDRARLYLLEGEPARAVVTIQSARDRMSHLPATHPAVARQQTHHAAILLAAGRAADAEAIARSAIQTRRESYQRGDWRIAESEGVLGQILLALGREDEAIQHLRQSAQQIGAALGLDHPRTEAAAFTLEAALRRPAPPQVPGRRPD